jgi:SAM-dependent methyltransferase
MSVGGATGPYRYDAYPYPERDPEDERKRLLTGSPSHLVEIDHYVFGGRRDWSRPFRALVAGGGTGDGLIMLAQQLADAGVAHEIVYVDRGAESASVAEKRAEIRGLAAINFIVGDFLDLEGTGRFDYIDCCGVLHHLADPAAGAAKLASLLEPDGGIGAMVYAPLGRTGVYPLQSALRALLADRPFLDQIAAAKEILGALPKTNWLLRNPFVADHKVSDAGLLDLLLPGIDRAYWADEVVALMEGAGLAARAFIEPIKYDPASYLPAGSEAARRAAELPFSARARLSEELAGSIKKHVLYACPVAAAELPDPRALPLDLIPRLPAVDPTALAAHINRGNPVKITIDGIDFVRRLHRRTATLVAQMDGRRPMGELLASLKMSGLEPPVDEDVRFLVAANQLLFSSSKA